MLFLDANAFYSYYGRAKLGMASSPVDEVALCRFLDNHKEKSLPTSVFMEIVTLYREDPDTLLKLIKFREHNGLPLYNNIPNYCITPDEITAVSIAGNAGIQSYAKKILEEKIKIETRFTFLFYEITRDLYAHYKLENKILTNEQKDKVLLFLASEDFKARAEEIEGMIKESLKDGYKNHNEQNVLKSLYIHELNEACLLIDIVITGASSVIQGDDDIIANIQATYDEMKSKGLDGNNGTMPVIAGFLANDNAFLHQFKAKVADMFKKGKYSPTQREYLRDVMFTAWFDRGQKLQKNDIFDMFCVGCLDYVDPKASENALLDKTSYVISFDARIKDFLGTVRPSNKILIDSIK